MQLNVSESRGWLSKEAKWSTERNNDVGATNDQVATIMTLRAV